MGNIIRLDGSWVTSREAADMMGVSLQYMYRLKELQVVSPVSVGGRNMYRRRDIERYIESHPRLGKAVRAVAS